MTMKPPAPSLSVRLGTLELKNPIIAASGTFAYASELDCVVPWGELGAVVCKGLSLQPRPGNPSPRVFPTTAGMLNSVGLQNVGLDCFLKERLPLMKGRGTHIIVNIFGESPEEYGQLALALAEAGGISALELNLSCPNIRHGHLFGRDPQSVSHLTGLVRKEVPGTPIWVKLPPDCPELPDVCQAAESAGADALTISNTIPGMAVDLNALRPALPRRHGGLSGPAIRPIILRLVDMALSRVSIPIVACGGVCRAEDALEYLAIGARAVQMGTAHFADPRASWNTVRGLSRFLARRGFPDMETFIGCVPRPEMPAKTAAIE